MEEDAGWQFVFEDHLRRVVDALVLVEGQHSYDVLARLLQDLVDHDVAGGVEAVLVTPLAGVFREHVVGDGLVRQHSPRQPAHVAAAVFGDGVFAVRLRHRGEVLTVVQRRENVGDLLLRRGVVLQIRRGRRGDVDDDVGKVHLVLWRGDRCVLGLVRVRLLQQRRARDQTQVGEIEPAGP